MTKILLVEDDKSLREIYGVRLLAEGYDIVSAGDGEEALAMAIKDRPALIVSDVMMPKISGFDMLDILRSTTETKDIKVIMMTALSSEDQRKRGEQLGADRYLVKSQVGIEDVVRAVHEVLGDSPVPSSTPFGSSSPVPATPAPAPQASGIAAGARPAAPTAPAPRPAAPASPAAAQPQPTTGLPQPTAPFSTPRPGSGNSLADRVIQPISQSDPDATPVADLIAKELSGDTNPPAPFAAPAAPVPSMPQTQTPVAPQQPAPAPAPTPTPIATPPQTPAPTPSPQPSNPNPLPPLTPPQPPAA